MDDSAVLLRNLLLLATLKFSANIYLCSHLLHAPLDPFLNVLTMTAADADPRFKLISTHTPYKRCLLPNGPSRQIPAPQSTPWGNAPSAEQCSSRLQGHAHLFSRARAMASNVLFVWFFSAPIHVLITKYQVQHVNCCSLENTTGLRFLSNMCFSINYVGP